MNVRQRVYGVDFAFLAWMRQHPGMHSVIDRHVVSDFDVVIHRYRDRRATNPKHRVDNLMILDTKTHARGPQLGTFAQSDTYALLNALFTSKVRRGKHWRVRSYVTYVGGEKRRVRWWGQHVLAMTGDRPENSEAMWWNDREQPIELQTLEQMLVFARDPYTLEAVDYRDHHEGEQKIKPLLRAMA
jgi:hypothetical protein